MLAFKHLLSVPTVSIATDGMYLVRTSGEEGDLTKRWNRA